MGPTPSSLAAGNFVSVKNVQHAVSAQVVQQKNVIIGAYDDATFTGIVNNVPIQVFSPEDVGGKTGYGFMLHRLAKAAFKAGSVETWIIPQVVAGTEAIGEIDFTGSTGIIAGTLVIYFAGDRVPVNITTEMTVEAIADAVVAAITADDDLPVTATKTAITFEVVITAKDDTLYGDDISTILNLNPGEVTPTGIIVAITGLTGAAGTPDIQDALDALGTGDGQNDDNFTNVIHGYGPVTSELDILSTYNGLGNDFVGNYKKEISRPFRALIGDVATGSAGLAAAIAAADLRRETDRTNGMISAPGSPNHPQEIAAQIMGIMAVKNSIRAQDPYFNIVLDGVYPGDIADRWTNDYDDRDLAVMSGVGTTLAKGNVLTVQNVITFYRPTTVNPASNGYRSMRNISLTQNVLFSYRANWDREKWQNITIVEDTTNIADSIDREKARDVDSVLDDMVALAIEFAGKAWLYNSSYTIGQLQQGDQVELRDGLTGFNMSFPVIYSGEGGIYNSVIPFDISIAVLQAGG